QDHPNGIIANPLIGDTSGLVIPRWLPGSGQFLSGQTTIRGEFIRLVNTYAALPAGSAAINAANPLFMPEHDILGNPRDAAPDIGAFENTETPPSSPLPGDLDDDGTSNIIDLNMVLIDWGK
ncbi:hypothetical protein LCGC14_0096090, partial [marine sediment metagenome]